MQKKLKYNEAEIEILLFDTADIVTTSGTIEGDGYEETDPSGWVAPRSSIW